MPRPAVQRARRQARIARQVSSLLVRRLWTRVRPIVTVVSGVGWTVLLTAVVLGIAGAWLGWQEFVYVAMTLLAGLVVAIFFVFGRASFGVTVGLTPRRVIAGTRAMGAIEVTNVGQKRSSPTRFELPVGNGSAEFVIPGLEPGQAHDELFAVPTTRRAVITAGPALSVRGDQLGMLRRTVKWADPVELFVHPVTVRIAPSAAGLIRDLEGEVTKTIADSDISFHAIRAYEPGDDRRNVHWRSTARTGEIMVKQFEETRRSQLTMMHTADRRWYASAEEFELAVSITASLGVQVIRDGTRLSVVSEEQRLRSTTETSLLDDSCRLEQVYSAYETVREFARDATKRLAPPSVAMFIAGSALPMRDFRAVETLFGMDTQTLGFRAEPGATSRISHVSGLSVVTVGELSDLPRLLRRLR
jgi:hypothetical protein